MIGTDREVSCMCMKMKKEKKKYIFIYIFFFYNAFKKFYRNSIKNYRRSERNINCARAKGTEIIARAVHFRSNERR